MCGSLSYEHPKTSTVLNLTSSSAPISTTADEKELVTEVFTKAIDCLSEEDKKLPQVEHVLPLLKRGIGIHHSGLLPLLKETTEILFQEGLIKVYVGINPDRVILVYDYVTGH